MVNRRNGYILTWLVALFWEYLWSPNVLQAKAPSTPAGMVRIEAGVYPVGHYHTASFGWGGREVYLPTYFIDVVAQDQLSPQACDKRGTLYPTEPELEQAIRVGLVKPATVWELTGSDVTPFDLKKAQELADAEGVGFYEVYLSSSGDALSGHFPYEDSRPDTWQARCAIRIQAPAPSEVFEIKEDTPVRSGRGVRWPLLNVYDDPMGHPKHALLRKGALVTLLHEEENWAFVSTRDEGLVYPEGTGWVPRNLLQPAAKAKK